MSDVKDILGVPRGAEGAAGAAPPTAGRAKPERMKRPEGMSREAFALLGGSNPVIPTALLGELKKKDVKPKVSTKGAVIWRLKPFKNQARTDGLELSHWVKGYRDANGRVRDAHEGDYSFAKYNKKVQLYRYDAEEWLNIISRDNAIASMGWGKEETDYLLDLLELYDLRFSVVADRYNFPNGPPRSLEDLKDRYYTIARKLLVCREGTDATLLNHPLLRHPYNAAHERARRDALHTLLTRDKGEETAENEVLEKARVIEERRRAESAAAAAAAAQAAAAARKAAAPAAAAAAGGPAAGAGPPPKAPLLPPLQEVPFSPADLIYPQEFANAVPQGRPSLFNHLLDPAWPAPGAYARGQHTRDTIAAQEKATLGASQKNQKALEAVHAELGYNPLLPPRYNSRAVCGAHLALRGEMLNLVQLRQQVQARVESAKGGGKRKQGGDGGRSEKRQRTAKKTYE